MPTLGFLWIFFSSFWFPDSKGSPETELKLRGWMRSVSRYFSASKLLCYELKENQKYINNTLIVEEWMSNEQAFLMHCKYTK